MVLRQCLMTSIDNSEYEQLFGHCLAGRLDGFKSALQSLRSRPTQLDPLQPAACLAAQKKSLEILRYCLDEGAVFDRYLTRAAHMGARGDTAFLEFLLEQNWANIQRSLEAIQEQTKHYGKDSMEAKWLEEHALAGKVVHEQQPNSTSEPKTKTDKKGKSRKPGQPRSAARIHF